MKTIKKTTQNSALAAKAREKRRLQELGAAKSIASGGPSRISSESFSRPTSATSAPAHDPIVRIFISSAIPNTVPLLVSRKLSQRLQEVRKAWCARQNFSEDMADSVFFTYRNRRLWDVTTCKSLGIDVDSSGNIRQKDDFDLYSENDGKIHLEAVTPEIWEENTRRAEKSRTEEVEEEEQDIVEEQPPVEEQRIRLFLKARGYEDFRLQVNPVSSYFHSPYIVFLSLISLISRHQLSNQSLMPTASARRFPLIKVFSSCSTATALIR